MGGMAMTTKNDKLLKIIADLTGGSYFEASDTTTLVKVYEQIDQLEKTKAESREYVIRTPLYRYPLLAALVLFSLLALMPLAQQAQGRRAHV